MKRFQYELSQQEVGTILAALRYYQHYAVEKMESQPLWLQDIASDCGKLHPMNAEEIDHLCEMFNCGGELVV